MASADVGKLQRVDVVFGRYRIIAGDLNGRCVAKLFLGKRQVLERKSDTVPSAVAAARAAIIERDRERLARREDNVPLPEEFWEALQHVADELPDGHLQMLRAHRRAPGQTLTSREIARAGGYKDFEAANLQYGLLGRKIAENVNYRPRRRRSDNEPIWTMTLATGQQDEASGLWTRTMRPEVAQALDELGW